MLNKVKAGLCLDPAVRIKTVCQGWREGGKGVPRHSSGTWHVRITGKIAFLTT